MARNGLEALRLDCSVASLFIAVWFLDFYYITMKPKTVYFSQGSLKSLGKDQK